MAAVLKRYKENLKSEIDTAIELIRAEAYELASKKIEKCVTIVAAYRSMFTQDNYEDILISLHAIAQQKINASNKNIQIGNLMVVKAQIDKQD